jgi:phosphoserine phosphatase RsbU/P
VSAHTDALASRLQDIQAVTDAALSRLDEQSLLDALLDRVKLVLVADLAVVLLADRTTGSLIAAAASGLEEDAWQDVRLPIDSGFAGQIMSGRQPVALDEAGVTAARPPLFVGRKVRSLLGMPLLAAGRVIGVMQVGSAAEHAFGPEEAELLGLAAERAAVAVQAMMSQDDRQAAIALHRSLTPSALPRVPGTDLAARYVTGHGNVGGDWYDVFALPSGRLSIVIGDVAGSGLQAAVIMGRMRSALRAYSLETADPAEALRKLDRKIQYFEGDAMATVLYGIYDPESGRLTVSSAGHLPPVLAVPGKRAAAADIEVDVPIGVGDFRRGSTVLTVPSGALLCCYTDGLVERRDASLDERMDKLAATLGAVAEAPPADPGALAQEACRRVMRALVDAGEASDDIAIVTVHRYGLPGAALKNAVPAVMSSQGMISGRPPGGP